MSILAWLFLGLISGFIGSKIIGSDGGNILVDIVVGMLGAFLGGFLFNLFGAHGITGFNLWSIVVAIVGSVVLLTAFYAIRGFVHRKR